MTSKSISEEIREIHDSAARGRPSEGVREAILVATLDLAQEHGLARLTTREIARRAQVSEASIFYHFGDKTGLLQNAMLFGLKPLSEIDPKLLSGSSESSLVETLVTIASSLERFFDRVLPLLAAVQGDAKLRSAFGDRLAERGLGPHKGVELLSKSLTQLQERGLVDPRIDVEAIALTIIGSCMLRAWQRNVFSGERDSQLPELIRTMTAIASLIEPAPLAQPIIEAI